MNFTTLKQELSDRGFAYLSDTRLGQYINWARAELDDVALWAYRSATSSGSAPLTVADLGVIETVVNTVTNTTLDPADRRDLMAVYGDLTTTGTPSFFYVDNGVVRSYPVGGTLKVFYYKSPADLTGTDVPLAPTRWHRTIVDIAARMAYRDADNHASAESLQVQITRDLALMLEVLLVNQVAGAQSHVQVTERW